MSTPTAIQRHDWRVAAFEFAVTGTDPEARLARFLMDAIDALEDSERNLRATERSLQAARAQITWHGDVAS